MLSTPVLPTEKKKKAKEKEGAAMLMVKAWMQIQAEKAEKMKLAAAAEPGTLLSQPTFSASGKEEPEEFRSARKRTRQINNLDSEPTTTASEEVYHSTTARACAPL
jgi:5-deoxy-D-glucuronate isomerase